MVVRDKFHSYLFTGERFLEVDMQGLAFQTMLIGIAGTGVALLEHGTLYEFAGIVFAVGIDHLPCSRACGTIDILQQLTDIGAGFGQLCRAGAFQRMFLLLQTGFQCGENIRHKASEVFVVFDALIRHGAVLKRMDARLTSPHHGVDGSAQEVIFRLLDQCFFKLGVNV